jgi:hypothetical protein
VEKELRTYQILADDLWWSIILFISTILTFFIFITNLVIYYLYLVCTILFIYFSSQSVQKSTSNFLVFKILNLYIYLLVILDMDPLD